MEEREAPTSAETSNSISVEDYEKMCRALYAYRFGTIGFLDLLTRFEEVLKIKPPQTAPKAPGTEE